MFRSQPHGHRPPAVLPLIRLSGALRPALLGLGLVGICLGTLPPQPADAARYGPLVKRTREQQLKDDLDRDTIPDAFDRCPGQREDMDGFQDEDGCPELDNDGDRLPDAYDQCPLAKEDVDGWMDEDGCPDIDNDGDGIDDKIDSCPDEAEDVDGFEDLGGCPDLDNDRDNIPDVDDQCPMAAETKNGRTDQDGCPE